MTENAKAGKKNGVIQSVEAIDGKLIVTIPADTNDPFITGPVGPYDGDRITGVEMKMRCSYDIFSLGGPAVYYFPSAGSHGSADYDILVPDEWNIVYIDLLTAAGGDSPMIWEGEISSIRVDFANFVPEEYTIEIDWIRLVDDRLENKQF